MRALKFLIVALFLIPSFGVAASSAPCEDYKPIILTCDQWITRAESHCKGDKAVQCLTQTEIDALIRANQLPPVTCNNVDADELATKIIDKIRENQCAIRWTASGEVHLDIENPECWQKFENFCKPKVPETPIIEEKSENVDKIIHENVIDIPQTIPEGCCVLDHIREWNVQAVVGQNDFLGLQGRYKDWGVRIGRFDDSQVTHLASFTNNNYTDKSLFSSPTHHTTICHTSGGDGWSTLSVDNSAVQAHLDHGDCIGSCEETNNCGNGNNNNECGNGICEWGENSANCPEDCLPYDNCESGECSDECPQNCEPTTITENNGWKRIGHTYSLRGLYYFRIPNRCSGLSAYLEAGVDRQRERLTFINFDGQIFGGNTRARYKVGYGAGLEFNMSQLRTVRHIPIVVGVGYDSRTDMLVHVGYTRRIGY